MNGTFTASIAARRPFMQLKHNKPPSCPVGLIFSQMSSGTTTSAHAGDEYGKPQS